MRHIGSKLFVLVVLCMIGSFSFSFAQQRNLPGITIISRAQRWANESWRYSSLPKSKRDEILQAQKDAELQQLQASDDALSSNKLWDVLQQQYQNQIATDFITSTTPQEQTVDEIRESSDGNYLKWPESIHLNKNKIIIHHTAVDYTAVLSGGIDAAKKELQSIYKYHTLTKKWWDIGYNFVIDPFGNIYEWRAGGPWVVWAHVSRNNTPTIGISLMGNFNIQKPTDAQLQALVALSTALAKKYTIDPMGKVTYFRKSDWPPYMTSVQGYAIAGHRDVSNSTACPGTNMIALLPTIRQRVKDALVSSPSSAPLQISGSATQAISFTGLYYLSSATVSLPLSLSITTPTCRSLLSWTTLISCSLKKNILSLVFSSKNLSSGIKYISLQGKQWKQTITKTISFSLLWKWDLSSQGKKLAEVYAKNAGIVPLPSEVNKISAKVYPSEIVNDIKWFVSVLLYDLSVNYHRWELICDGACKITIDGQTSFVDNVVLESNEDFLYLASWENYITPQRVEVSSSSGWLVTVSSYERNSYGKVPRNTFHGSLIFKKNPIKYVSSWSVGNQFVVINKLSFGDYMKGIAETSDTDTLVKQEVVLLLAKMYTLFYMNGSNIHPSIPAGADYRAIDNPDMYQKYVGAGREKTSKSSATILAAIKNKIVLYSGYVPILPYFSCSAGFTWSAKDKWWWIDTPYLQYRPDFAQCFDFSGHGVGLSGKGAQYLSQQWWSLDQILDYYYPGVSVVNL